jgi:hypothetical protein
MDLIACRGSLDSGGGRFDAMLRFSCLIIGSCLGSPVFPAAIINSHSRRDRRRSSVPTSLSFPSKTETLLAKTNRPIDHGRGTWVVGVVGGWLRPCFRYYVGSGGAHNRVNHCQPHVSHCTSITDFFHYLQQSQRSSSSSGGRRKRGIGKRLRKNQEIENVVIRETFQFDEPNGEQGIGEGGYITAEINSRLYYGVLIDQDSLRAASILHLRDEASGLDLNKRMEAKLGQKKQAAAAAPPITTTMTERPSKRPKMDRTTAAAAVATMSTVTTDLRGVQKFRYVPASSSLTANTKNRKDEALGYRMLLATYSDVEAAAEGSDQSMAAIQTACEQGGDFVGAFYYQYQVRIWVHIFDLLLLAHLLEWT